MTAADTGYTAQAFCPWSSAEAQSRRRTSCTAGRSPSRRHRRRPWDSPGRGLLFVGGVPLGGGSGAAEAGAGGVSGAGAGGGGGRRLWSAFLLAASGGAEGSGHALEIVKKVVIRVQERARQHAQMYGGDVDLFPS